MEGSILCDNKTLCSADLMPHGISRKLDDEFKEADSKLSKDKSPRLDDEELAKDHMGVFLRVRPFTEKEISSQENQGCMEIENHHLLVARAPVSSNTYKNSQHGCGKQTHRFTFTKIFEESTTQKDFFDNTVLESVKDFIEGHNSLIFTYGVTNSGKTYTIQGHAKDGGILPRALDVLFNSIGGRQCDDPLIKPSMFCDVVRLTVSECEDEQQIKKRVFDMAIRDEESDVTVSSLVGDSDTSHITNGSQMSEDSLNVDSGNGSGVAESSDKSAIDQIFKEAAERVREDAAVNVTTNDQHRFSVWVTFSEIYNEYIYDLLEPIPKKKTIRRPTVTLREDKHGIPYVKGVKQIQVSSADEAYKILVIGKQNLQMACTKLNHNSSRSHCIFTIKLVRMYDSDRVSGARVSLLSFCDLAGAERYSKTFSAGERIKEAGNINTSLLSLGRCIKILRHNQLNKEHPQIVPFRDSKLTRIFQSSLTGKGKASMIVNINQCASTFDETLHALKYSAIAKQVVVVQDPIKEPELPKSIPAPGSSRYVSMLLAQAHTDPSGPRPTIGFGTPDTLARIFQEEEDAIVTPKVDEDQEAVLINIIETLKMELIKERNEKNMLEWNVRSEVFTEVQEQFRDQERHYEERLNEMKERMENRTESKVNLLLQSMKKKKRRHEDDDENVLDQVELLKAALEAKDAQLEFQSDRIENLEKELEDLGQQPNKTPPREQPVPAGCNLAAHSDQMAVIEQLQVKLSDARGQLETKESEVVVLGEMLTEAGETFEQKSSEIEKKSSEIESLKRIVEALRTRSAEQETHLKKLSAANKTLEAANAKDCSSCQEQVVRLGEVVYKLADTEAEVDKINSDFVRLQQEAIQKTNEADNLRKDLGAEEHEISELTNSMHEGIDKESKIVQMSRQIEVLEKELAVYRDANKGLEKQAQQVQDSNIELTGKVGKLQEVVDEHQDALRDHENFVAELNKQLTEAKSKLEALTLEHMESSSQRDDLLEKVQREDEVVVMTQKKLVVLQEECDQLTKDLAAKDKRLMDDGRRSLQLENKMAGFEQSLQQANGLLRKSALEAATLKETLDNLKKEKQALEDVHTKCKPCIDDLQSQLDEYIVQVNKQADDIEVLKEKLNAKDQNADDLQVILIEAQGKLVDQDGDLKNLRNKITDLETRLAAERKQQKSAGIELDELLQNKAISIEELNTNVSQLRNKLNKRETELKLSNEQIEHFKSKIEQLTEELKDHKSQLSIGKVTEGRLREDIEEAKEELGQVQEKFSNMVKDLMSIEKKSMVTVQSLRLEVGVKDKKIADMVAELKTAQDALANTDDLDKAHRCETELRQQLADLSSHQEEQNVLIHTLEDRICEARENAKHQEQVNKGDQDKLTKVREELQISQSELSAAVDDCEQLTEKLHDQKTQLSMAKVTEGELREDVGAAKEELGHVQEKLSNMVETLKNSEEQSRVLVQSLQSELDVMNKKITAMAAELKTAKDAVASTEDLEKAQRREKDLLWQLAESSSCQEELNKAINLLENQIREAREDAEHQGEVVKDNQETLVELREELQIARSELSAAVDDCEQLTEKLTDQKTQLSMAKVTEGELREDVGAAKEELGHVQEKLSNMVETLKSSKEESSVMVQSLQLEVGVKDKKIADMTAELKTTKDAIASTEDLEKAQRREKDLLLQLAESSSRQEEQNKVVNLLEDQVREAAEHQKEVEKDNQETLTKLREELRVAQSELSAAADDRVSVERLTDELHDQKSQLSIAKATEGKLRNDMEEAKKELGQLEENLSNMGAKMKTIEEDSRVTVQSLRLEVGVKDKKIEDMAVELKTAKEAVTSIEDLEKAHRREKDLRRQLAESSSRQEEQNKIINKLEDRVREARQDAERQEEVKKGSRETLAKLKEELRTARSELSVAVDERESAERRLSVERSSLQVKVETLEAALEKKEIKIKARSTTISDLMAKMETERSSYEISTQDARANEAVLGQLKKALEDQDATIELQEKALTQKEEDMTAMQKEQDALFEKYNSVLKDTSSQSTNVRDLTKQISKLREERKEAERVAGEAEENLRQARAAVGRSDKEKVQFKRDMEDTNQELRKMEKILSDARREIDQLKLRLSEMRGGQPKICEPGTNASQDEQKLALLKTKFIALESTNGQLEGKLEDLQKEMAQAEINKKAELEHWREDRDKLVSQLEKILKQKEAQIIEMKKASANTPKTDHELSNRIDKLELELTDKDAIIDQLSRHLDSAPGKSRGGRRTTRHNLGAGEDTAVALRKETDELRKQFEAERQSHSRDMALMVKAKDEIINDLKHTNLQLQTRLPGATRQPQRVTSVPEIKVEPGLEDANSVELSTQKAPPRKANRAKSRSCKRKSSELETVDKRKTPKRQSTRKQQEFQLQVSFDGSQEGAATGTDEDVVELGDLLVTTPAQRTAVSHALGTETLANFISPVIKSTKKLPKSERSQRRVKLRGTVDEPFGESPPKTAVHTPSKDQSHDIVTRQLRTRKKYTKV